MANIKRTIREYVKGVLVAEYSSMSECSKSLGVSISTISTHINHGTPAFIDGGIVLRSDVPAGKYASRKKTRIGSNGIREIAMLATGHEEECYKAIRKSRGYGVWREFAHWYVHQTECYIPTDRILEFAREHGIPVESTEKPLESQECGKPIDDTTIVWKPILNAIMNTTGESEEK